MKTKLLVGSVVCAALAGCGDNGPTVKGPVKLWEATGLANPESAYPDVKAGVIYVSNVNGDAVAKDGNGTIAKVTIDGKNVDLNWATGLNAPKGMGVSYGHLFVGDVDELVEIDLKDGKIIAKHAPVGAKLLNDVAVDSKGAVYVADTLANTIFRYADGKVEEWVKSDKFAGANGLAIDGDNLILNTFGKLSGKGWETTEPGKLFSISLADKTIKDLAGGKPIGNLDALVALGGGNYLVTDWIAGKILKVTPDGTVTTVLEISQGTSDFGYDPATKIAYIPMMLKNSLVAYKLE